MNTFQKLGKLLAITIFLNLTVSPTDSKAQVSQDSVQLSIIDYGFYLEWASFGQHADTMLIPLLQSQIKRAVTSSKEYQTSLNTCKIQKGNINAIMVSQEDEIKKAQRGKRWAVVGNGVLLGVVGWLVVRN